MNRSECEVGLGMKKGGGELRGIGGSCDLEVISIKGLPKGYDILMTTLTMAFALTE